MTRISTSRIGGSRIPVRVGGVTAVALAASLAVSATPAFANTSNPTTISAVGTVNNNGSETVTVSGTWTWPAGQQCIGRYGTG